MGVDKTEEFLGAAVKVTVPGVTLAGAAAAGIISGAGPAILVLTAGMMTGAIAFVWTSLRALGEPDSAGAEFGIRHAAVETSADETKLSLLRTLKDLQHENAVGKMNDDDYQTLAAKYRGQLKDVLREIDLTLSPHMKAAEELAAAHMKKRGATAAPATTTTTATGPQRGCAKCSVTNEPDAVFCKKCGQKLERENHANA